MTLVLVTIAIGIYAVSGVFPALKLAPVLLVEVSLHICETSLAVRFPVFVFTFVYIPFTTII